MAMVTKTRKSAACQVRFHNIPDPSSTDTVFSWNPCYGYNDGYCKDMAISFGTKDGTVCGSLGNQASVQFVASTATGLEFRYTNWGGANYSGHVIITCEPGEEGKVTRVPDEDYGDDYYLELKSKYACPVKTGEKTAHATGTGQTWIRPNILPSVVSNIRFVHSTPFFWKDGRTATISLRVIGGR